MVRRSDNEPISRRHVWLYDEDWEFITQHFGDNIGTSKAIRTILHAHIKNLREKANANAKPIATTNIELDLD